MGRKSAIRDNYRADAIALHRILGAIEQDDSSPDTWKREVSGHLNEAMRLLLEHSSLVMRKAS